MERGTDKQDGASLVPHPACGAPLPPGGRGDGGEGPFIPLRDSRLLDHLVPLLERWDTLADEDQALLLSIAEFVADRQRRRGARQP